MRTRTLRTLALTWGGVLILTASLPALTVDDAVRQAREHNLGLAVEDLKVAQKADEKTFSFNRLYPTVTANAALARLNELSFTVPEALWPLVANNPSYPYPTTLYTEDNHWNLSLGLNVQFLWNPAVFRGMAQTQLDFENARLNRDAAAARLERDVRKAFAQLLALHEATAVFESQLKVAEDRYKLARLNVEAGLGSELALLQAQVALENRRPALADQRLNEETARNAFKMLLNLPADADLTLEGTLEVAGPVRASLAALDPAALAAHYAAGRWDAAVARGTARSLENLTALQADSLWPSLVVGWSADPTVNAPFLDDRWKTADNYAQRSGALTVGVAWKLDSLLPGSTTGLEIASRQRQAEQARVGAEQVRRAGEAEIRNLAGRLQKSAGSLGGLGLALSLAQRSAKLTEAGWTAGNQSFNDVQDADLQFQAARLQYLNEELALLSALADLDYALAADRKDWLRG